MRKLGQYLRVAIGVSIMACAVAFCTPALDPRNTCGPKVPLSECIK
jgi:hypothetical protein